MDLFEQSISAHFGDLSDETLEVLRSYFIAETLEKGALFTEVDQPCGKMSLIQSGLLRVYKPTEERDVTQWISSPGYFITEITSFFFDQPSRWSIQALTEVELLTIDKAAYQELCVALPEWKEIETQFIAKCFAMLEDRVFSHLSMSAEDRYDRYFEQNKALFNEVPLQYIASVLGMTPETFSRIRKRKANSS